MIVVAGHKDPAMRDDDPRTILDARRTYIRDFDKAVAESAATEEVIDKMMQLPASAEIQSRCGLPQTASGNRLAVLREVYRGASCRSATVVLVFMGSAWLHGRFRTLGAPTRAFVPGICFGNLFDTSPRAVV